MSTARRPHVRWAPILFLALPLAEFIVLVQVGRALGAGWTILLLVLSGLVGGWLIRREGLRAWGTLNESLRSGRMPTQELADRSLVMLAGVLLLSPGFVSDLFALLLIFPGTRGLCRRLLSTLVAGRMVQTTFAPGSASNARRPGPGTDGSVIQGEVVDP